MKSTAEVLDYPTLPRIPANKVKIITPENEHELPADVRDFLQELRAHKYFPRKYWTGQKRTIIMDVHELYRQNPTLPVKQVVLTILADLPDFLPSWNIHRVVGYITQTWKELSQAEEAPEPILPEKD